MTKAITERFTNPDYRRRWWKQTEIGMMKWRGRHPNKLELAVIEKLSRAGLPYRFTGDGSFFIAGKNPDFVSTDGSRRLIEVAGDFWHTPDDMARRVNLFEKYGCRTLVLWEHDLMSNGFDLVGIVSDFTKTAGTEPRVMAVFT